jgi:hypothetical protein
VPLPFFVPGSQLFLQLELTGLAWLFLALEPSNATHSASGIAVDPVQIDLEPPRLEQLVQFLQLVPGRKQGVEQL